MFRLSLSRFSCLGTLQSRAATVEGSAAATLDATRTLDAAERAAEIVGEKGYVEGRSFARPDLSPGVTVSFEEVYSI